MYDAFSVYKLQFTANAAEVATFVMVYISHMCPSRIHRRWQNIPQSVALHAAVHTIYNPRIGNLITCLVHRESALRKIHRIIIGVQIVFEILLLRYILRNTSEGE